MVHIHFIEEGKVGTVEAINVRTKELSSIGGEIEIQKKD